MYLFEKVAFPTISRKQIQHPTKDGLHKKIEGTAAPPTPPQGFFNRLKRPVSRCLGNRP